MSKPLTMDEPLRQAILAWAQEQLDAMPEGEYGGDWWGAFSDEWDINIWDSQQLGSVSYDQPTRVTAYPMTVDGRTDHGSFVSIGFIQEPADWYFDHSCGECGEPMRGKGDGTRPTRYPHGYAHGQCVYEYEIQMSKESTVEV
ncbi:MAG: hypothetical protein ACK55Z_30925 [bacterium]